VSRRETFPRRLAGHGGPFADHGGEIDLSGFLPLKHADSISWIPHNPKATGAGLLKMECFRPFANAAR
jgi:hypothetical protein